MRVKLALSYAGFLVVAGIALFVVGFLLLRFVPEGNLSVEGGGFAPNRTNLVEVFVRYAWWAMGLLVVFGLVGGWLLAGVVLRPLDRITDAARQASATATSTIGSRCRGAARRADGPRRHLRRDA